MSDWNARILLLLWMHYFSFSLCSAFPPKLICTRFSCWKSAINQIKLQPSYRCQVIRTGTAEIWSPWSKSNSNLLKVSQIYKAQMVQMKCTNTYLLFYFILFVSKSTIRIQRICEECSPGAPTIYRSCLKIGYRLQQDYMQRKTHDTNCCLQNDT